MKKLLTAVVALALALTVVAPAAASAQASASYTFNANLTMGSRGADVVALQTFLEGKGLLTIPAGTAKGYFGSMTRSALSAYQTMKGITPAAGYFGPVTRAAVMADMSTGGSTGTPGCPAGAMFNSVTGQSCSATPATPGCPAGALYNSATGQPCTSGQTPIVNTGVEGSLDVRLAATPADNANVQTQTDVPVYGLELKARLADVAVQTVDLQVSVLNGSSADNPGTFINTIKVWDGSTVVATIPVNQTTFTKDSNSVYYVRLSGLNYVVPKDATKFLTVSFSTNLIDSDRVVTIDGYQSASMRVVSGNGVNSFISLDTLTKSHTFKKPGNSSVVVTVANPVVRSMNIYASSTTLVTPERVTMTTFNVKSSTGDSKLTKVVVTVASSSANAAKLNSVELWDGSTMITSRSVAASGNTVTLDNIQLSLPRDVIKTLTLKGNFASNGTNGSTVSLSVTSFDYEQPNGSTVAAASASVTGETHYLLTSAAEFKLAGTPTVVAAGSNAAGSTTNLTAAFDIDITPRGGTMSVPTVTLVFATTTVQATAITNGTSVVADVSVAGGATTLPEGTPTRITASKSLGQSGLATEGTYYVYVKSVAWTVAGNAQTQTWGWEEYKTQNGAFFKK